MKSASRGRSISAAEVTHVSTRGIWVLIDDREFFAPFEDFPWFRDATIGQLTHVERPSPEHLYWPELDVDLAVASLECPEAYPLVSRKRPTQRLAVRDAPVAPKKAPQPRKRGRTRRT